MSLLVILFALIIPGIIAKIIFKAISGKMISGFAQNFGITLAYDFIIFAINITILEVLKSIGTFGNLTMDFNYLQFTAKYMALSFFVGIVIGVIAGITARILIAKGIIED